LFPLWLLLSPALWSAAAWVALAFSPPTLSLAGKRWMSARRGLRGNSKSERVAADGGTAAAARGSLVWRRHDRLTATGGGRGEWPLATLPPPPPLPPPFTAIATPFPWQRLPSATQVLSSGTGVNWWPAQRHH